MRTAFVSLTLTGDRTRRQSRPGNLNRTIIGISAEGGDKRLVQETMSRPRCADARPKRIDGPRSAATIIDLVIQRGLILSRLGRQAEAERDLGSTGRYGGQRAVLHMPIYLRSHGFRETALDGQRSDALDEAVILCFVNDVCSHGLTIPGKLSVDG